MTLNIHVVGHIPVLKNHFSALFDLLVSGNPVLGRCIDENGSKPWNLGKINGYNTKIGFKIPCLAEICVKNNSIKVSLGIL